VLLYYQLLSVRSFIVFVRDEILADKGLNYRKKLDYLFNEQPELFEKWNIDEYYYVNIYYIYIYIYIYILYIIYIYILYILYIIYKYIKLEYTKNMCIIFIVCCSKKLVINVMLYQTQINDVDRVTLKTKKII
jgi:hypothetical protein